MLTTSSIDLKLKVTSLRAGLLPALIQTFGFPVWVRYALLWGALIGVGQVNAKAYPLIFNEIQALLVETLGATYASFFIGRLLDQKQNAFDILSQAKQSLKTTKILAASLRSLEQVELAIHAGAEVLTIPAKVFNEIFEHPLTLKGIELFKSSSLLGKR